MLKFRIFTFSLILLAACIVVTTILVPDTTLCTMFCVIEGLATGLALENYRWKSINNDKNED